MIHVLSEETINKIAAGEVIENPASVVKEIVENSIDAGSSHITIETKGGGLGLIRVSDDGQGMGREDALLSLERHATSKIAAVEDLFVVQTMGFRGEALASIAAISKLTLTTKREDQEGVRIEVAGGKVKGVSVAARSHGTTIEVSSIFYNVPARLKFQKSQTACTAEVTKTLTHLALAYPHISFELIQQERTVLSAPKEKELESRIRTVLGEPFYASGILCNFEDEGIALKGVLGAPQDARPNRGGQYLFINGRSVVCPALSFAVKDGYGTRIEPNRFPAFVLHLQIAPDLLDVNVHPQKKEVRLQNEATLKQKVKEAIFSSLGGGVAHCEEPDFSFTPTTPFSVTHSGFRFKERAESVFEEPSLPLPEKEERFVGLFHSVLLLQRKEELLLVDLIALRARLLFETLQTQEKQAESQVLLLPLTLTFTKLEIENLLPHLDLLKQSGFDLRSLGETALIVDAHPPFLQEGNIRDLLLEFAEESSGAPARRAATLASRLAKRGNKNFTEYEGMRLFEELKRSGASFHSPLGKPIIKRLAFDEIEKLFTS